MKLSVEYNDERIVFIPEEDNKVIFQHWVLASGFMENRNPSDAAIKLAYAVRSVIGSLEG